MVCLRSHLGLSMDGPQDDFDRKGQFWNSSCMIPMSLRFDRQFTAKLQSFVDAGIDIDKLPSDLKLFAVIRMTVEEARELTA